VNVKVIHINQVG